MVELLHLQELQRKLVAEGFDPNCRPCEIFDLIGGTSTGGLIAFMLVRMRMTIPEILGIYEELSKKIFQSTTLSKVVRYIFTGSALDSSILEQEIKKIIHKKLGVVNAPVYDADFDSNCKVFVRFLTFRFGC